MTTLTTNPVLEGTSWGSAPLIPVFVYGTLRIGEGNYEWAKEAVRHEVTNCTTPGRIYFCGSSLSYPVAKFEEEGTIKGDLLWFDPDHPVFGQVVDMEIHAGYVVQEIEVIDGDGDSHEALGFQYVRQPLGDLIPSGDWKRARHDWRKAVSRRHL